MIESKKILVAEDDADLREAIATALAKAGFTVIEAADGQIALNQAKNNTPDLIILDIKMPQMTGLEVLQQLRADDWGKKVPVIMLTAQADINSLSDAVTFGGTNLEYLTKTDWKLSDVVKKVKEKLGDPQAVAD